MSGVIMGDISLAFLLFPTNKSIPFSKSFARTPEYLMAYNNGHTAYALCIDTGLY